MKPKSRNRFSEKIMNKRLVRASESEGLVSFQPPIANIRDAHSVLIPEEPAGALATAGVSEDEGACSVLAAILRGSPKRASTSG
jgi:hypothetical protein